jgi:hypothetical protein
MISHRSNEFHRSGGDFSHADFADGADFIFHPNKNL